MARKPKTRRRLFVGASVPRAVLEVLVLGWIGLWGLLSRHTALGGRLVGQALFFYIPLVALWGAMRMRVRQSTRLWRRAAEEFLVALTVSPLVVGVWLALIWLVKLYPTLEETPWGSFSTILLFLTAGPYFLLSRVAVHVWLFWQRLQRRRLVWALTNTQLQLVVLFAVVFSVAATLMLVIPDSRPLFDLDTWVLTLFPFLGVTGAMTLMGVAGVLPVALLLAWLTARRTTRRLEALTTATATLREGDYNTVIPVEGEDEVAQLQCDFNTMAAALSTAVKDLQAERDKVASLLETRRQLVVSISHELRTPLATVRGYLESAQQRADAEPVQHELTIMARELDRLQALIDDLFTLSRVEVGKLELTPRPVDLGDLIRARVEAAAGLAWRRQRVRVIAEVPDALPPAYADAGRLEQILVNLLHNALRHTPPGGIVAVTAGSTASEVWVRVADTGEGVAPEDLEHVWERFYRGDQALQRDSEGSGLGLALVKELTGAMGGRVAVESTVGVGSTFTLQLPRYCSVVR